jgi:hypothetical protein
MSVLLRVCLSDQVEGVKKEIMKANEHCASNMVSRREVRE